MAASSRIFHSAITPISLLKNAHFQASFIRTQQLPPQYRLSTLSIHSNNYSFPKFTSFNSFPIFRPAYFSISSNFLDRVFFGKKNDSFHWNFAPGRSSNYCHNTIFAKESEPEVAVVMLGWLGARPKHLRRYVELYNGKGIHVVSFVASVMDVLSVDMGRKLEERIQRLTHELVAWLSNENGRERFLMFHTFSNTGWLTYGSILENMKDRLDMLNKIKGCVVDSGGDPNIDPKVWAAGFTTALLKKSSSATYPSTTTNGRPHLESAINESKIEEKETSFVESMLLFAFEKLFSNILNLPYVNQKLTRIISCLTNNQPHCPQLYLYSSGDKVIPYQAVESFVEYQKKAGKKVLSFDFGSSPHVDHYRTFPEEYASQLDDFLKECLSTVRRLQKCYDGL